MDVRLRNRLLARFSRSLFFLQFMVLRLRWWFFAIVSRNFAPEYNAAETGSTSTHAAKFSFHHLELKRRSFILRDRRRLSSALCHLGDDKINMEKNWPSLSRQLISIAAECCCFETAALAADPSTRLPHEAFAATLPRRLVFDYCCPPPMLLYNIARGSCDPVNDCDVDAVSFADLQMMTLLLNFFRFRL